jgi:hypothetical protein
MDNAFFLPTQYLIKKLRNAFLSLPRASLMQGCQRLAFFSSAPDFISALPE